MTDQLIIQRLDRIERLLMRLIIPVEVEEGRQVANCTDDQRVAHNKDILARRKALRGGTA
jgi:hypothetical protein